MRREVSRRNRRGTAAFRVPVFVQLTETDDLGATEAPLLGTERMIRADVFAGQPCPTDPPSLGYSWLYPRFGWDYYICHTFDSPW